MAHSFAFLQVAYSFDAGANAFLFTLNKSVPEICGLLQARFGVTDFKGDPVSDFCLHEVNVHAFTFKTDIRPYSRV